METKNPHVVVLGAGFGGLTFCQTFNHRAARVTLFDRQNHHLFQPLLYQVATAGLSPSEIAQPIRSILSNQPNVTVLLNHVMGFDLAAKIVRLEGSTLTYSLPVEAVAREDVMPASDTPEAATRSTLRPQTQRPAPWGRRP
jgi:NADH dehydrogenase